MHEEVGVNALLLLLLLYFLIIPITGTVLPPSHTQKGNTQSNYTNQYPILSQLLKSMYDRIIINFLLTGSTFFHKLPGLL